MTAMPIRPIVAGRVSPVRSASRSHVGRVRPINEDRVFDRADIGLWAVTDGMGGHRGGDLAAQTVVDELRHLTVGDHAVNRADVHHALASANQAIVHRNRDLGFDAGATIVAALWDHGTAHIAWAGDSRAYRLRDGRAELLTQDHSVVQELVTAGLLTPDMAERHPQANVITRALGVGEAVELDWISVDLAPGDRLLLCSDGLSRSLGNVASDGCGIEALASALLEFALHHDGSDNISLVVVEHAAI